MQILRQTPAELELLVYVGDTLTDLDADPTLAVTDANGDVVSTGAVTRTAAGTYLADLAGQPDLSLLKAEWTGALSAKPIVFTRRYEIVANLLFSDVEARNKTITGQQTPIESDTAYPDDDLARVRAMITDQFEQRTGRAWIRRYARAELGGSGGHALDLARARHRTVDGSQAGAEGRLRDVASVIAASIGGTAVDPADLAVDGKKVYHTAGSWPRRSITDPFNVVVEYEYGPDPVPLEANENGLWMALDNLVPSDVSSHAQTFASPDGTISFAGHLNYPTRVWEWLKNNKPVLVG